MAEQQTMIILSRDDLRSLIREGVREALAERRPKMLTVEQAASHFGFHKNTIHNWIKRGCPVRRIGPKEYRLDPDAVAAWRDGEEAPALKVAGE